MADQTAPLPVTLSDFQGH